MENISIKIIGIDSAEYDDVWQLREEVLRKPIDLSLKDEDLSADAEDTIFAAIHNKEIIGCVMMHPLDKNIIKLRQMGVYPEWQSKGIGKQLVDAAEDFARQNNYTKIVLHARDTAKYFYEKLGYTITSDLFIEVGIPHIIMEKEINLVS